MSATIIEHVGDPIPPATPSVWPEVTVGATEEDMTMTDNPDDERARGRYRREPRLSTTLIALVASLATGLLLEPMLPRMVVLAAMAGLFFLLRWGLPRLMPSRDS